MGAVATMSPQPGRVRRGLTCDEEGVRLGRCPLVKRAAAAEKAAVEYAWPAVFDRLFCIYREVCANYRRAGP